MCPHSLLECMYEQNEREGKDMNITTEEKYLKRAIEQFEKTGRRFYRENGIMVLVNEHTITRYKEMTREESIKGLKTK